MNAVLTARMRLLCCLAPMSLLLGNKGCEPPVTPEPEPGCVCPAVYDPVCGEDGKTYGNSCEAACVEVGVDYEGECRDAGMLCLANDDCAKGETCDHSECLSPCGPDEICPAVCYGQCEPSDGACEPVLCKLGCEHGFATGEDGCEICDCAPPPSPIYCLGEDACGKGQYCDHSECLSPCGPDEICPAVCYGQCLLIDDVTCKPVLCRLYCENGFATDKDGCEICECAPPASPTYCLSEEACGKGEYCDHSECLSPCGPDEICPAVCYGQCLPKKSCEPVLCKIGCEHGFATDENGCEICACAPPPAPKPTLCLSEEACATGEYCDHSECLSPCGPDEVCPAVCYGQCLPDATECLEAAN